MLQKGGQQHARHHFAAAPGRGGTRRFYPAREYVPETGRARAGGRHCSVHRALARAGGATDLHGDQLSKVPDWEAPKMAGPLSSAGMGGPNVWITPKCAVYIWTNAI